MRQFISIALGAVLFSVSPVFADDELSRLGDVAAPEYTVSPPRDFANVKLAAAGTHGAQSVAVNPKNANVFLATYANQGSCWVRTSTNAGQTWAAARKLPTLTGSTSCLDAAPAVVWAPDGSRVYVAYSFATLPQWKRCVVLSSSNDRGLTWSGPKIIKQRNDFDFIMSLRLATPLRTSDAKWVYLVSHIYSEAGPAGYATFTRSADHGQTWSPVETFAMYQGNEDEEISSPSIAGGLGGEVLVAWGFEYFVEPVRRNINVRRSGDFGRTFSPDTIVRSDSFGYTSILIGQSGTAHLVYHNYDTGTDRRPMYIYSTKAPYTAWSQPVVLSDNISASAYYSPALSVSACGSGTSVLHAVWLDDRAGSGTYNVYYTRKVAKTGENWSSNLRVSGTTPVNEYGYPLFSPAIAAGVGTAVGLWGQPWEYYGPRPVWASRIAPGVTCP